MSVISPRPREKTTPLPPLLPLPRADRRRRLSLPLSAEDRDVLWLYLLTRTALWITAYGARWLFPADAGTRDPGPVLVPFERWDWGHFLNVARDGYFPAGSGPWDAERDNREAFFPGFPLALRAVHTLVPSWTAAGLLISLVAGGIAVLALVRIARLYLPEANAGRRTAQLLLLSPCAVFLATGYSESLFLAFALPAWLAAHRRNWPLATTLAALATTVRISGLFLAAALALHFVLTARVRSDWRPLPWLALPALPAALYAWYLHARTGDWMAWKHAQERGGTATSTHRGTPGATPGRPRSTRCRRPATRSCSRPNSSPWSSAWRWWPSWYGAVTGPKPSTSASACGPWGRPTGTSPSPGRPSCGGPCGSRWPPGPIAHHASGPRTSVSPHRCRRCSP